MNRFHCAVWIDGRVLSHKEAAKHYAALLEGNPAPTFDRSVYAFVTELTRRYPELDEFADDPSCPWACALDFSGEAVIMALMPERYADVFPVILQLSDKYGLVCFDPQNTIVHLPSRPLARNADNG